MRIDLPKLTPHTKAELLYDHCVSSGIRVGEAVHSLYAVGKHYRSENSDELKQPEIINGIPPFFATLSRHDKADFCFNKVTEVLAAEAAPVTVESLLATRRMDPDDPTSSFAGRFVLRVTRYVTVSLLVILALYLVYLAWNMAVPLTWQTETAISQFQAVSWVAFGCIGALVHLLNHALTSTRLNTFQLSEERKVWPRILLGGMFGFVLPWLLSAGPLEGVSAAGAGTIAAFFGGYSVRFSIGLLERVLAAIFPETKPGR